MDLFGWLMTLPIAVSVAAWLWLAIAGSRRALAVTLLVSLAGLMVWGFMNWTLRDGLLFGPPASHGADALQKFWMLFWRPLAAWAVFLAVTCDTYAILRK